MNALKFLIQILLVWSNGSFFNNKLPFEISSVSKARYPSSQEDTTLCWDWHLSMKEIKKVIGRARSISGNEWHYGFEHLPCAISGRVRQGENIFEFKINGGGWFTVSDADTTLYFGYYQKDSRKLFWLQTAD